MYLSDGYGHFFRIWWCWKDSPDLTSEIVKAADSLSYGVCSETSTLIRFLPDERGLRLVLWLSLCNWGGWLLGMGPELQRMWNNELCKSLAETQDLGFSVCASVRNCTARSVTDWEGKNRAWVIWSLNYGGQVLSGMEGKPVNGHSTFNLKIIIFSRVYCHLVSISQMDYD